MPEIFALLIVLMIICLLSGPIALIVSLVALNKIRAYTDQTQDKKVISSIDRQPAKETDPIPQQEQVGRGVCAYEESAPAHKSPPPQDVSVDREPPISEEHSKDLGQKEKMVSVSLEQKIGTQWLLVAGVITVIVGVALFLKYAYENQMVGPLGRVISATGTGLIALAAGEITRRKGFDIVAKAVTAMGFAILYLAVYSAYHLYDLIGTVPALGLAILITFAAMVYAVVLDEVLMAVLSLIGGFLTPILFSTGENLPTPLFTYVLILSIGAMLCAWYRNWRAVNLAAFAGTFLLYIGWFEKFYRPVLEAGEDVPAQTNIAIAWLGVFFSLYLLLPLLNGLVRKTRTAIENVFLVLANACIGFYYLSTILEPVSQKVLAFCAVGLGAVYLGMTAAVLRRCRQDDNLRHTLLLIGLFFLTISVPLYFDLYAVAMVWAMEAVVLILVGIRYRSICSQIAGAAAMILTLGQLFYHLPMHSRSFDFIWNPVFGTWAFTALCLGIIHIFYRKTDWFKAEYKQVVDECIYISAGLVLMGVSMMEWYWHSKLNLGQIPAESPFFIKGMILLFAVFTLLFVIRPVTPRGPLSKLAATVIAFAGTIFTMGYLPESYTDSFVIFANSNFAVVLLMTIVLFTGSWFLHRSARETENGNIFIYLFAVGGIVFLWFCLSQEIYLYWYCRNLYVQEIPNWQFLANMYISILWALYGVVLMATGFWRNVLWLRYLSLGLFGLLLGKVFIFDMSGVESVYRIAAFLATGLTLVGVSYLYQYLKNKGFFDNILSEKESDQ